MNKGNIVTDIIERTIVEEQLTFAKFAVDRAADCIYWIKPDASFFYVNDAACKSLGYSRDELLSMHVYDIDPLVNKKTWQQHWEIIKRDKYFHAESQHRARDGRIIDIDIQANHLEFEGKEYDCAIVRDITERKIIEKNLTRLHERNNALVNALGEIVYEWYPQLDKIFWEGNYTKILGYSEEEMGTTTQNWKMRICPDDLEMVLKEVQEATIQNRNFDMQYRYLHKDGNYRWMHDRGVINLDKNGQLERITGVFVDITEHRHAENALLESEQKFSTAFMSNPDAITITSIETGRIIDINKSFEKLFGFTRDMVIGKTTLETMVWNNPGDRDEIISKLNHEGQIHDHEVVLKLHSGECRTCLVSSSVIKLNSEKCAISIIHDVTERRQVENELQESQLKLQNILDSMFTFVGLFSIDGILLEANRAPLERASLTREQVIGKPFINTYWWAYSKSVQERLSKALQDAAQGKSIRYDELVRIGEDQYITIDFMVGPLYDSNGRIIQLIGSAVDITQRKLAEDLLTLEKGFFESIASEHTLREILDDLLLGTEEMVEGMLCSVLFFEPEQQCMHFVSGPNLPDEFIQKVDGSSIGPCNGSCGTALYRNKRIIVSDTSNDPLWANYQEIGPGLGIHACWSTPILSASGQILGSFANIFREPRKPTDQDIELIERIVPLITLAIEHDQTKKKFNELYSRNKLILNSAGEGIYGLDIEGKTTFINPAAAEMLCWKIDEIVGGVQHELIHHSKQDGSKYPKEECPIYTSIADGKIHQIDNEIFWRKDGTSFPVEYISTPIRGEKANITGAVVIFKDITERKNAEIALERNEEHLRFLYEENPSMYFTIAADGTVLSLNSFGAEELGYTVEELTGKSVLGVFPENEHASVLKHLQNCLKNFSQLYEWEIQKVRKNGEKLWVKETARAVGTPNGGTAILLVCRDITERKLAEDRLRNKINQDEFIADFGRYILKQKNTEYVFNFAISGLAHIMDMEFVKILKLLPDGKELLLHYGIGWESGLVGNAIVLAGLDSQAGYTLQSKEPVVVSDLREETRFTGPELLTNHGVVSGISTVIEGREHPYGVLGIHSRQSRDFTSDDISFVQTMANILAEVIEHKHTDKALLLKHQALTVLSRCNDVLIHATNEIELLKKITTIITESDNYLLATVAYVVHDEQKSMRVMAGSGNGIDYLQQIKVTWGYDSLGCGPWGTAVKTAQPYISNNLSGDHQFLPWLKTAQQFGFNSTVCFPLSDQSEVFGILSIYSKELNAFDENEFNLLNNLASNLAYGITAQKKDMQRKSTEEEVEMSRQRLRNLATRLQIVREDERKNIAREIHDELGQTLTGIKMDLSWIQKHLPKNWKKIPERFRSMITVIDEELETIRNIALRLRPAMLDDLGLEAAIEWELQEFTKRLDCRYTIDIKNGMIPKNNDRDTTVFRILQEALTNIARHANANYIMVSLKPDGMQLVLTVKDNGIGIREENITSSNSLGLIGMHERAVAMGGELHIIPVTEGGTELILKLPLTGI